MVEFQDLTEQKKLENKRAQEVGGLMRKVFGTGVTITPSQDCVFVYEKRPLFSRIFNPFLLERTIVSFHQLSLEADFIVRDLDYFDKITKVAEEYEKIAQGKVVVRTDYSGQN